MAYEYGEEPAAGDYIKSKTGRLGTVTEVKPGKNLIIKWDDGVVGISYKVAEQFELVSRSAQHRNSTR